MDVVMDREISSSASSPMILNSLLLHPPPFPQNAPSYAILFPQPTIINPLPISQVPDDVDTPDFVSIFELLLGSEYQEQVLMMEGLEVNAPWARMQPTTTVDDELEFEEAAERFFNLCRTCHKVFSGDGKLMPAWAIANGHMYGPGLVEPNDVTSSCASAVNAMLGHNTFVRMLRF
jgi:hypothetical protein